MSRPVVDALIGIALLSFMDATVKSLVATVPVAEVAFLRYVVGSAAMLVVAAIARPGWPRPDTLRANGVRAIAVVVTAFCFFYALGHLPLAETLLLSFLSPLFTALLATRLLDETLSRRVGLALAAGFAGVLVIVVAGVNEAAVPQEGRRPLLGALAAIVATFSYSASIVMLRARASRDPLVHIVLVQNVAPALMLAGPAWYVWTTPSAAEIARLLPVGLLGVGGHLMLARAYARAEAVRLAPLDYTALVWALLIGILVYDEIPGPATVAGGALILVAAATASRR